MNSDENAELYASSNSLTRKLVQEWLTFYKPHFQDVNGAKMVDVGCADGSITCKILGSVIGNYGSITGIDYSKHMVNYAIANYSNEKVNYLELDITTEDLPKTILDYYDKIFSFFCFMWIPNQKKALQNMNAMLKLNGEIFFIFTEDHPFYGIFDIIYQSKFAQYATRSKEDCYPGHYLQDNVKEYYCSLLRETGFEPIICDFKNGYYKYSSINTVVDFASVISPFSVPDKLSQEYKMLIKDACKQTKLLTINDLDNMAIATPKLIIIYAKKVASLS